MKDFFTTTKTVNLYSERLFANLLYLNSTKKEEMTKQTFYAYMAFYDRYFADVARLINNLIQE